MQNSRSAMLAISSGRRWLCIAIIVGITLERMGMLVFGQAVPPVFVDGTATTVPPGSIITVTSAATPGLHAINPGGQITANGITINLGPGPTVPRTYIGAQAEAGGVISLDGTTISTVQAATGQRGIVISGAGSQITGTGTIIQIGLTTTASDNLGVLVNGGSVTLTNATVQTAGGVNGIGNHAIQATGADSSVTLTGGSVSTGARGSFGAVAQDGATITLEGGTQITTTGAQNTAGSIGSHALYATGSGSEINATGAVLSTSGLFASGARAELGGTISLIGSSIATSSTSSADTDPASGARALSGGQLVISGSTITTTGQRGNGFSVEDAGSLATISDTTITTSGDRAPAALISNGGHATVINSSLTSNNNTGVFVQGAGSNINLTNTAIRSAGAVGYGLRVTTGGSATMTGGSSTTEGRDGPGLFASNGSITATDVTVMTSGSDNSMGALADLNGQITLNGGSVTTTGNTVRAGALPHGLVARNPGATLTANGTTVLTTGSIAMGAVADDGGVMILNGNSITTRGSGSLGLFAVVEQAGAQFPATITGTGVTVETFGTNAHGAVASQNFLGAPSLISLTGSTVTTHAAGSHGLRAITGGTVNSNQTTVLTEGAGSNGLHARDNGSSVNVNVTTVLSTGANAHGSIAESGGLITGNDSTVRATGSNGSALYVAGAPGFVSAANFTGSTLTNVNGPTIGVGGNGNVSLTNSSAGGSGQWLRVGTINDFPPLAAAVANPIGGTDPEGTEPPPSSPLPRALPVVPGLANIALSQSTVDGSAFTAAGSVSNVTMADNSVWNMTADSNITNLDIRSSLVQYSAPIGPEFKILTLNGNLSGGGLFGMNTDLGRIEGDLLVIEGLGSGDHEIFVTNRGGSPTGPGQALRIVQTTDGIAGAQFALANPGEQVEAGMFIYRLRLGNNRGNTPDPLAWYLVNETSGGGSIGGPILSNEGRVIVNTVAVLPSTWFDELHTLHQRMGELRLGYDLPADQDSAPDAKAIVDGKSVIAKKSISVPERNDPTWDVWIRTYGRRINAETDLGGRFHEYLWGAMLGADRSFRLENSRLWVGVFGGYSRADRDFNVSGDGETDSVFGGAYGTWISDKGWYLDAVGKVNRLDNDLDAVSNIGQRSHSGYRNWGIGASLEGGRQFVFEGGWFIEPQLQAAYTHLSGEDYTTESGIRVRLDEANVFQLRAGFLAGRKVTVGKALLQPYLKASAIEALTDKGRIEADGLSVRPTLDGFRFEGGVGIMAQLNERNQLYVDYTAAVGQKIEQPWSVNVGFRHVW